MNFFWVPAVLMLVAGALLLLLPVSAAVDPLKRRNRRTAGILFLAAGAAFALVAGGTLDRLL